MVLGGGGSKPNVMASGVIDTAETYRIDATAAIRSFAVP